MLSSLLILLIGLLPGLAVDPAAAPAAVPVTGAAGPVQSLPATGPLALFPGEPPAAPEQVRAARAAATDRAAARVEVTRQARAQAVADQARLARQYEAQLDELDRLKRQRASWRRDRLIRTRMSESHATAEALDSLDQRIRRLDALLRTQEQELVAAIARERAAGPVEARRVRLDRWQRAARPHLRRDAKKIVLPDDRLDLLADPEELEHQAALIRQSEEELAAELDRLERQAERYQHMAALHRQRSRAAELGALGEDRPRRSTGHAGNRTTTDRSGNGGDDVAAPAPPPAPPGDGAPGTPEPGSEGPGNPAPGNERGEPAMFDIILADVVDAPTLQALRAADRSSDPAIKARAAQRAHQQVRARLERLRKQRQLIQKRAQELRGP